MTDEELAAKIEDIDCSSWYDGSGKRGVSYGEYLSALYEITRLRKQIKDGPPYQGRHHA